MSLPLDLMTPLLVAALAALWSERAGVLNIAVEGQMLAGALTAVLVQHFGGGLPLALSAALLVGLLTGLVLAWAALQLRADPFIAALGLNLLLPALAGWVSFSLFGNLGVIRLGTEAPSFAGWPLFLFAALALAAATHAVLFHTPWGLRVRAAGTAPDLLAGRGIRPMVIRRQALALSGALAALAGAFLALQLGAFVPGISAGRGWIALVALYLGFRHPGGLVLACFVLAGTEQAANALQAIPELPAGVVLGLPSLITLVVFVVTSAARSRARVPGMVKRPSPGPNRR